jgi:integrase
MAVYKRFNGKKVTPKDKDWDRGTWVVEFELRGHRVHEAIPEAQNKRQAEQAETSMRQAIFDRKYNKASGTVRLLDFIDKEYLPWARENKRSFSDDEQRAVRIKEFFGNRLIRDVAQPLMVEKFKSALRKSDSKLKRPFSPATVNRHLTLLSGIFSMACKNGLIESNPVSKVKPLREPEPRGRYLNQYAHDEEERLLNSLAVYGEYMVTLASLDLETGMRLGELLLARWEDVNMLAREIFVRFTKNGKSRTLPLTERAVLLLTDLRQGALPEDLIFDPEKMGRRRRQTMVVFEKAVGEAGLDDFTFHDLRRTFATRLRAAGVHEYDIADLLGHSTTPGDTRASSVTRGYARAVPQRLRDAVELLEVGRRLAACPPTAHQVASGT